MYQQGYISKSRSNLQQCSSEMLFIKASIKSTGKQTSTQKVFIKKQSPRGVLNNFTKSTEKHQRWICFLNKLAGCRAPVCNSIKEETLAQLFSCGLLRTLFLPSTSGRLFQYVDKYELYSYIPIFCGDVEFATSL